MTTSAALVPALALAALLLPVAPTGGRAAGTAVTPPVPARPVVPASSRAVPAAPGEWPLAPRPDVVSGFDPPASHYGAGHRGVDLAGTPGQAVRAAVAGRVTFAGKLAGRGVVVVTHGATRTTYEPVSAGVGVGEAVAAGEQIGTLEAASSHCAPAACLHWGLLEGDTYLDPLSLVGAGPVRLLPLFGDGAGW